MTDIILEHTDNLSGLRKLLVIPVDNIFSWPTIDGSSYTGDIFLTPGSRFYEIQFTWDTAFFSEDKEDSPNGPEYSQLIEGFIPRDTPAIRTALKNLDGKELVVVFLDQNGRQKLAGHFAPLKFRYRYGTSRLTEGIHGYFFSLQAVSVSEALFYSFALDNVMPEPILIIESASTDNLSFTQTGTTDAYWLHNSGTSMLFSDSGKASFIELDFDNSAITGSVDLSVGWDNLRTFRAKNSNFRLKPGSWINNNNVLIDVENSLVNKIIIADLISDLRTANGTANNTGRTLIVGDLFIDNTSPFDTTILDDINYLEANGWTIISYSGVVFEYNVGFSGTHTPSVIKSGAVATWFNVSKGTKHVSNTPSIFTTAGDKIQLVFETGYSGTTRIDLGNGNPFAADLDLTKVPNLLSIAAINGNFKNMVANLQVQRIAFELDVVNSFIPNGLDNTIIHDLLRDFIIANGGTYTVDANGNYTGSPGANFSGRQIKLGFVPINLSNSIDKLIDQMASSLATVNVVVTTIRTLCKKYWRFYLTDISLFAGGNTALLEINTNYTLDRPAGSNLITNLNQSQLDFDGADFRLLASNKISTIATGLVAINNDLITNNRIGSFVECTGNPIGNIGLVEVTIDDFPVVGSVCGSSKYGGLPLNGIITWFEGDSLQDDGAGNATGWTDKSFNNNNANTVVGTPRVEIVDGFKTLFNDGDRDWLETSAVTGARTVYVVFKRKVVTNPPENDWLFVQGLSEPNRIGTFINGSNGFSVGFKVSGSLARASQNTLINNTNKHLSGIIYTSSALINRLDGSQVIENESLPYPFSSAKQTIGNFPFDNRNFSFNGNIFAIMTWDRVLNASEIQAIESYLSNKYGITI